MPAAIGGAASAGANNRLCSLWRSPKIATSGPPSSGQVLWRLDVEKDLFVFCPKFEIKPSRTPVLLPDQGIERCRRFFERGPLAADSKAFCSPGRLGSASNREGLPPDLPCRLRHNPTKLRLGRALQKLSRHQTLRAWRDGPTSRIRANHRPWLSNAPMMANRKTGSAFNARTKSPQRISDDNPLHGPGDGPSLTVADLDLATPCARQIFAPLYPRRLVRPKCNANFLCHVRLGL